MPIESGPGLPGKAADDLLFNPEDLTLTPACGKSPVVNSEEGIGDLIFDPDDQTFVRVGTSFSNARDRLLHYYQLILTVPVRIRANLTTTRGVGVAAFIMLLGITVYTAFWDSYRVNSRLLFFQRDTPAKASSASLLEREVEMLKNRELASLFASDLYRQLTGVPQAPTGEPFNAAMAPNLPKIVKTNFKSAGELADWLQKAMSMDSEISNGVARVSISLQGDDPELLKTVMDAYISRYAENRLMLEAEVARQVRGEAPNPALNDTTTLIGPVSEQLQRIELQEHGCALALKLIDQGKGVFSGFVPDTGMAGTPSLAQFQEKIVQLEIKKRALEVQFTPNAREVRTVDLEIKGVKRAMRECLVEQLEFLKKGKEQLLAQRDLSGLQKTPARFQYQDGGKGSRRPDSVRAGSWTLIRDGLYMLRDSPHVVKNPLLVRAGNLKRSILAYLSPAGSNKMASDQARTKTSSRLRATSGSGADLKRLKITEIDSRERQRAGSDQSDIFLGRNNGSHVKQIPRQSKSNYWESVPASHFGRKSLW